MNGLSIRQCLVPGRHIEQFLVDRTLALALKPAVKAGEQLVDVLVGTFHRRQAAGVLARQRLGASTEQGDEEMLADQCAQRHGAAAHHFGRVRRWPALRHQVRFPLRVKRQQALVPRVVEASWLRPVIEDVDTWLRLLASVRFRIDLEPVDERGDGLDRIRYRIGARHGDARLHPPG